MSDDVQKALENYQDDKDAWGDVYKKALEDLKFLSDDPYAQWSEQDYNARVRTNRPALTLDQLSQFIHQTANDIRMNTPSIGVIPANTEATEDIAEVYKGLIREIEYYSNADDVYDTASLNSIRCSIGFIRVDFEYEDEGFNQRLCLKRVVNPLSVFLDAESIECDGRDAKRATILDTMLVEVFKKKYPNAQPVCFESDNKEARKNGEYITVAEVFTVEEDAETIVAEDGETSREMVKRRVARKIMSGAEVLEESTFPGKFIPVIPVYGEEAWINGKRHLFSLIRKAKPAQQMFNYWKSLETELLLKAPQAPVMAAEGQTEDYAEDWLEPEKAMVLRYKQKDVEGNPAPPPQRLEPPTIPTGIVNASRSAVDDIKAAMGIYNAGLGMMGNEVSGVGIRQRQQEGDVATFHFQDNLTRSITQVGRVLVSCIPEIYNGPRVLRILGMEDEPTNVAINGALNEALQLGQEKPIDLASGRYDVRVKTGGSYTTRRQEAAEFLTQLVQTSPEMMNIVGDLMFENMDFTGSNVMAERMRKVIDPKFLENDGQDPRLIQLAQQLEQSQQMIAALEAQLGSKQAELQIKAQGEENDAEEARVKAEIQLLELQLEQQKQTADVQMRQQELQLKERELRLKEAELQLEAAQGREITV